MRGLSLILVPTLLDLYDVPNPSWIALIASSEMMGR
jgi:hypothetical protein